MKTLEICRGKQKLNADQQSQELKLRRELISGLQNFDRNLKYNLITEKKPGSLKCKYTDEIISFGDDAQKIKSAFRKCSSVAESKCSCNCLENDNNLDNYLDSLIDSKARRIFQIRFYGYLMCKQIMSA